MNNKKKARIAAMDIALVGAMVAVIEACKWALAFLPNIELTSFWIIIFTILFGWRILFVIPVFILIEGSVYGFGLWWIMYLYAWPLLALVARLFKKIDSPLLWATISGSFGLLFGFLCSFPYLIIGGIKTQIAWWVAGIPWDIVHCIGNFVLMLILYKPVTKGLKRLQKSIVL